MTDYSRTPIHFSERRYSVEGTDRRIAKVDIEVWYADDFTGDGRSYSRGHVRFTWHAEYPEHGRLETEGDIWSAAGTLHLAARLQRAYAKLGPERDLDGVRKMLKKLKAVEFSRGPMGDLEPVQASSEVA
jgi:hypothetical protein